MVLHVVSQSAKLEEVSSATTSYGGPTVTYALNTTYHVKVDYNDDTDVVTETVINKANGEQVWSYFVATQESLKGMNRIYIGSVGDYGTMGQYATGWIDNVAAYHPGSGYPHNPDHTAYNSPAYVHSASNYEDHHVRSIDADPNHDKEIALFRTGRPCRTGDCRDLRRCEDDE